MPEKRKKPKEPSENLIRETRSVLTDKILEDYENLIRELEKELALKTKRITKLEAFVSDVLRLSRYPWLHPDRAEDAERLMVQELLERAWKLLPDDNKASLTATQYFYEAITYAQNDEPAGPEDLPGPVLQGLP